MRKISLDARLGSVAELVRDGVTLADIGTDHAYLPIYLLSIGRIQAAVCSDINQGPLGRAEENVSACGFSDKVRFCLCDGARELEAFGACDYAICGMGGELIRDIIEAAPYLKNSKYNLILQPMSRASVLREYLASAGFSVIKESYSECVGKRYVAILARYTGECSSLSTVNAEFGESLQRYFFDEHAKAYADERLLALSRAAEGKRLGGEEDPPEARLYSEAKSIIE